MSISALEVDRMSLWQFAAQSAGFQHFHGGEEKPEAPSDEEYEDMLKRAGYL